MSENIQEEIEDKIIDYINADVAGRLVIFKPEKSSLGADLSVERKGDYKNKEIYLQVNTFVAPAKAEDFVKDFSKDNFKTDKSFYLLFVYFDEVRQKIGDYVWLVPSIQFADIAEAVKGEKHLGRLVMGYPKDLLRFRTPLDVKKNSQYSKFVVDTKELGKLILEALEKGGKFKFEENRWTSLGEKKSVNLEGLKEFLCFARQSTYSLNASPVDIPRLVASTQMEFQKGDYFFRDIFFRGDKKITGQEVVYLEAKPIWCMNYIGTVIGKMETDFLKEGLLKTYDKCRIGNSCEYEKREMKYQDQGQGDIKEFSGQEQIFSKNKSIYKLDYQGGLISDKL